MTQQKIKELKQSLNRHVSLFFKNLISKFCEILIIPTLFKYIVYVG